MKRKWNVVVLLLSLLCASQALAQNGDIAVVVNSANRASGISMAELRKLFAGEKQTWPGGQTVKLFVRAPGTPERNALMKLLNMTESEYKKYWAAQVFKGEAQAEPLMLPSNGIQKEAVHAFPGALVLMATADVKTGLKVLKVNGLLPGEAGYPLH